MLQFTHFLCVKICSKNLSGDFFYPNDISGLLFRSGGGSITFGNSNYSKGHKNPAAVLDPRCFISEHLSCALLKKLNSTILEKL